MIRSIFDYTTSLFVILDPFVSLVILLSILNQSNEPKISKIAAKASLGVLIGSAVCILAGSWILRFFGIDISAFRVMGGFVLLFLSLNMVQAKVSQTRQNALEAEEALQKEDIAIIPLAIPGTLGPGTITTLLIYQSQAKSWLDYIALFIAVVINCVLLFLILANARWMEKTLGKTVIQVFTRIMGLLVGAIAIQFIVTGVKELWLK